MLALGGATMLDFCHVLERAVTVDKIDKYPVIIDATLAKPLKTCFFGDDKNTKTYFNIDSQMNTLASMYSYLNMYALIGYKTTPKVP